MITRSQHLTLTGMGAAALALVIANGALFTSNKTMQTEINMRQAVVQQTAQLQGLQTEIAKSLAELALKTDDRDVLAMLASNGITVTRSAGATPEPSNR